MEQLPGAKMGLVVYIFRNPYQPAKSISKYDEEFLVATLSRLQTDAKLLQQEKHISAVTLNKYYHDNKPIIQISSTQYTNQILNIISIKPKLLIKDTTSLAPPNLSSDLPIKRNHNFISDPATRVHLTQNKLTFAQRKSNQNFHHINCTKFDSTPASRVYLTQNQQTPAQHFNTLKSKTPNHKIFNGDFNPRVRLTYNKFTLAGIIPSHSTSRIFSHNSNALFATHTSNH